jgi:ribonuclease BN (tRNA processing enzyme)
MATTIFSYHTDTVALGTMAQRAAVPHLVLTHLVPAPSTPRTRGSTSPTSDGAAFRGGSLLAGT